MSTRLKLLLAYFLGMVCMLIACNTHGQNLESVANELYLCNYTWHTKEVKNGKLQGLVYFECYYTLDEVTITTEYKTLVVLSKNNMFIVNGRKF